MAVLGQGESDWHDPESYPPILSRMIKIARFMVVQKALWMDPQAVELIQMWDGQKKKRTGIVWALISADNGLYDIDEVYASASPTPSPPSSPPTSPTRRDDPISMVHIDQSGKKSFRECVTWMTRQFMVRGTHSPMETLMDWRTYRLKVHYNTTAPGHVTWMAEDRLLYQAVQFTMGDFRGFMHGLVGAAREICNELVCMTEQPNQIPAIPWAELYNNPSNSTPG